MPRPPRRRLAHRPRVGQDRCARRADLRVLGVVQLALHPVHSAEPRCGRGRLELSLLRHAGDAAGRRVEPARGTVHAPARRGRRQRRVVPVLRGARPRCATPRRDASRGTSNSVCLHFSVAIAGWLVVVKCTCPTQLRRAPRRTTTSSSTTCGSGSSAPSSTRLGRALPAARRSRAHRRDLCPLTAPSIIITGARSPLVQ
mmetsp:Transcript_20456/g.52852  ORF Transcript_20456/g.52852 Transcript_20456/m.52852 type:complete len:200 (+) Transcript_20456:5035-5634(+)